VVHLEQGEDADRRREQPRADGEAEEQFPAGAPQGELIGPAVFQPAGHDDVNAEECGRDEWPADQAG
jgi:hypothetical protein